MPCRRFSCILTVLALFLCTPPTIAAPVDELLQRVPDEVSLCLAVRDFRGHARSIADSPFAEWFPTTTLGKKLIDPKELDKYREAAQAFGKQIDITPEELRDEILGEAVVLAYRGIEPGVNNVEYGVILVKPRKPELLSRVVERLNTLQKDSGEIKAIKEKSHQGVVYFEREKVAGGAEYYFLHDGVFGFSGQQQAIQAVIDRERMNRDRLVYDSIQKLKLSEPAVLCWFNPRRFDAELAAKQKSSTSDNDRAFLSQFSRIWAATDSLAITLHPKKELEIELIASVNEARLPPELQPLLRPRSAPTLFPKAPDDAVLLTTLRFDPSVWLKVVSSFLPGPGQVGLQKTLDDGIGPILGKDKLPGILSSLGPTMTMWLRPGVQPTDAPRGLLAIQVDSQGNANLGSTLLQAAVFIAQTIRIKHNRLQADQLELIERNGIHTLANSQAFPPGWSPSFGVRHGYFILATSAEELASFDVAPITKGRPIVTISGSRLHKWLSHTEAGLAKSLAPWLGKSEKDLIREWKELAEILEVIDQLTIDVKVEANRLQVTGTLKLARPLSPGSDAR